MRRSADILRSLKRYLTLALGDTWELRLSGEEGAFSRPFARVGTAGPGTTGGSALDRTVTQPFTVVCHPVEMALADDARLEAARVEELLWVAFNVGIDPALAGRVWHGWGPTASWRRAHPLRVPLYDYDGIPLTAPAVESDRDHVARIVAEPSIEVVAGDDELLLVVVANIRMSWSRSAAVLSSGVTLDNVKATPEGT